MYDDPKPIFAILFWILIILALASGLFGCQKKQDKKQMDDKIAKRRKEWEASKDSFLSSKPSYNWDYISSKDEMTDKITKLAILLSTNSLDFEFPYNGGTSFHLFLRQTGKVLDAYIKCNNCMFDVSDYENDYVVVRIDDNKSVKYRILRADDQSYDIIFFSNPMTLIESISSGKELRVEAPFYQSGRQIIRFNIENLDKAKIL